MKLDEFRALHRLQQLVFDMARALTLEMCRDGDGVPAHALFPQLAPIIHRYLTDKVLVQPPADIKDVFLSPYYGWVMAYDAWTLRQQSVLNTSPDAAESGIWATISDLNMRHGELSKALDAIEIHNGEKLAVHADTLARNKRDTELRMAQFRVPHTVHR